MSLLGDSGNTETSQRSISIVLKYWRGVARKTMSGRSVTNFLQD